MKGRIIAAVLSKDLLHSLLGDSWSSRIKHVNVRGPNWRICFHLSLNHYMVHKWFRKEERRHLNLANKVQENKNGSHEENKVLISDLYYWLRSNSDYYR